MPSMSPSADLPAGGPKGTLYVVATPIGNREDITLRALKILSQVDMIAAEDTRHTGRFLAAHGIRQHLISCHEHNESERATGLIGRLCAGRSIALVSSAGTPTVSDPGYALVKAAVENGIAVIPVPGVSAAAAAMSVCGLPTDAFVFVGFCSRKKTKRGDQIRALADQPRTIIFYESPRRVALLVSEIREVMGNRRAVLCREMTKIHEEYLRGRLSDIETALAQRGGVRGECTLLVAGPEKNGPADPARIESDIREGLSGEGVSLNTLAKTIAVAHGLSKSEAYKMILAVRAAGRS